MKLQHCLAALLLCTGTALAQDDCRLDLSESRLDFGLMNRAVASAPAAEHLLGERRLSLTLNCPPIRRPRFSGRTFSKSMSTKLVLTRPSPAISLQTAGTS